MNLSEMPTPETLSRYQKGDDMFAVSQDLERRLTVALRENERHRKSFNGHVYVENDEYAALWEDRRRLNVAREALERIFKEDRLTGQDRLFFIEDIARDALTQTAPKP